MNREALVGLVVDELKAREYRKHVTAAKHVFTISDDEGHTKDFVVTREEKNLYLTINDVRAVVDAMLDIVEESLAKGEPISIRGFGVMGLKYRQPRASKRPGTDVWYKIKGHWVPKFSFGTRLAEAAHRYEMQLESRQLDTPNIVTSEDGE